MKKHKNKIIAGIVIAFVLIFVYWWGGNSAGLRGWSPEEAENTQTAEVQTEKPTCTVSPTAVPEATPSQMPAAGQQEVSDTPVKEAAETAAAESKPQNTPAAAEEKPAPADTGSIVYSESSGMEINETAEKDRYETDPVPDGKPAPIEPQDAVISDKELTCTLSVRCDTILQNISWLDAEKAEIVPEDGVILAEKTVTFYEGESVFNLLVREMKRNKIHLEFVNTPIHNSAYIEGIANLYEFDCGELSGWMYKVNGWFPNYGCSRYQLKAGDKVEWVYTCDLGSDVGGGYGARNGM
ncbi:MAG: DUF4430 domain-containing protein [Clostridia bacterium]|nr:DUF4430 domain-containing protein [Clostridia bacterium]